MEAFRGRIEGGICLRSLDDYVEGSERRYFVIHGAAHSVKGENAPDIVNACKSCISSNFLSVDGAQRAVGVFKIGDGQVSDVVGWSADRFTSL